MLRPVGHLERASTSRHSIGFYRNVIVTARYRLSTSEANHTPVETIIESAVSQVVRSHPALNVGIVDEHTKSPYFLRLKEVDIRKCIEYTSRDLLSEDQSLTKVLEEQHERCFPDVHSQPPWRLIILPVQHHQDLLIEIYACFVFHHAIGDGISGTIFHRSLLHALRNPTRLQAGENNYIIQVPESLTLAPPVEKLINFKLSWTYMVNQILKAFGPAWMFPSSTAWTGSVISMPSVEDYKSRLIILSYQPTEAAKLISACHIHKTTVTGLLHGVLISSLSKFIPEAQAFSGATPYSLRGLTGSSMYTDMAVQVSTMSSVYPAFNCITACETISATSHMESQIWRVAQKFSEDIKTELASLPNDNLIGMLPYVGDWHSMWKSKLGTAREHTFEMSNVGAYLDEKVTDHQWKIKQMIFSQPGIVTGAALCLNVASVKDALLSITVSWQDGILDEELANNIAADIDSTLRALAL